MRNLRKFCLTKPVRCASAALVMTTLLGACSTSSQRDMPGKITFERNNLYPEGIAWQKNTGAFLVSSLRQGEIGAVTPDGRYQKIVSDPELLSVIGIKYDGRQNRILACNSHPGASAVPTAKAPGSVSQLMVFDAKSGQRIAAHDLAALRPGVPHFCNDMTTDTEGNIYVTDSFVPIIYRVSPEGNASIFLEDPAFVSSDPGKAFALNGIVYHPDGYLLANHMALGKLFRIDLKTKQVSEVALGKKLEGADGMALIDSGTLAVVKNGLTGGEKEVVRLASRDGWKSASETGKAQVGDVTPTTVALAGSDVYVIDARLSELFDGKGPRSDRFSIHKARFD